MSTSIGTTRVEEIMNSVVVAVLPKDQMEYAAKMFEKYDVNAAPVVDDSGVCVGIITSHDLVEYEAKRFEMQTELKGGYYFDVAHYGEGMSMRLPGHHFDEVAFHMTKKVETAEPHFPLSRVARMMCQKHFHHVLVLDEEKHPIGILSSLDILGHMIGEKVARHITHD